MIINVLFIGQQQLIINKAATSLSPQRSTVGLMYDPPHLPLPARDTSVPLSGQL